MAPASQNPIWNANLSFPGVPGDELMERILEITLWDLIPHNEHAFLGECSVDIQKAFLDDRAVWCRLEDPRQLRGRSPHNSPRGSNAGIGKFGQRSMSDEVDSIGECGSLLHPDHAWGQYNECLLSISYVDGSPNYLLLSIMLFTLFDSSVLNYHLQVKHMVLIIR